MKIDRPGGPKPPTTDRPDGVSKARDGGGFAERLGGGGPDGPGGPGGPDPIARVAAELRAGNITPEQAIDRVIDAATDAAVPERVPEALRAQIREQLARLVEDDPVLAARARRVAPPAPPAIDGGDDG